MWLSLQSTTDNVCTPCVKNDSALTCYNFHEHRTILIIFDKNVAKKISSQMVLYFLTSLSYCFCTTQGNRKPKIASFHLNAECCFANRNTKHIHIITWSQLNHPSFAQELAVCTKQNLGRSISCYCLLLHMHSSFTKSVLMSFAVWKVGVVLCRT